MDRLIKINNMNIVSSWSYIMNENTECTICRQSLNNPSLYAQEKGNKSTLSGGTCGHMYHSECIKAWLNNNTKCPICSVTFNVIRYF
jgi:protein-arginine kinase activator protein McsA